MGNHHQDSKAPKRHALLARPLEALVFLLPLIAFYQVRAVQRPRDHVIAFDLMRWFVELFGPVGAWAPALAVVVILFATHLVSREPWTIRWGRVGWMYVEAVLLAVPLLAANLWISTPVAMGPTVPSLDRVAIGIGAGIYEELVFRLLLIGLVMMIGVDLIRLRYPTVGMAAVVLSAFAFAAHHYQPIGADPFELASFAFRAVAGVYLSMVFWYRGYGAAAGCHAAYNVVLAFIATGAA